MAKLIEFQTKGDDRGSLVAIESGSEIPFDIKRVYYIFETREGVVRGLHAHKKLKQVLVCISGSCTIILDDGNSRESVNLSDPSVGLLIESCIWREMLNFSPNAVLLVLADQLYDEGDYIRNYDDFILHYGDVKEGS